MKTLLISSLLFIFLFTSCSVRYGSGTFNRFARTPRTPVTIPTDGYYAYAIEPRYERYGDSIRGFTTVESICHFFIILSDNGKAYVDLNDCNDGLQRMGNFRPPKGKSTKWSAHDQFLRAAKEHGYFNLSQRSNGNFRMYNDTIFIMYYESKMFDYRVIELIGTKLDSSSFKITRKESYPFRFLEHEIDSVNMVFRFEKYVVK